jgi:hypothetical protein
MSSTVCFLSHGNDGSISQRRTYKRTKPLWKVLPKATHRALIIMERYR